ncbi:hypothetical protein [Streptomyces sp. NPDC007369]|uniref:hypothetical protein n=1 Tax=Streptomyces sp. NPDC007369 TaxID=3154589 RepID=UPI0033FA6163
MAESRRHVFVKPPQPFRAVAQVTPLMVDFRLHVRFILLAGWRTAWFHSEDRQPLKMRRGIPLSTAPISPASGAHERHPRTAPLARRFFFAAHVRATRKSPGFNTEDEYEGT